MVDEMIVSRCCRSTVWVYCGNEGTSFYVCEKCAIACDTLFSLDLTTTDDVNAEI